MISERIKTDDAFLMYTIFYLLQGNCIHVYIHMYMYVDT